MLGHQAPRFGAILLRGIVLACSGSSYRLGGSKPAGKSWYGRSLAGCVNCAVGRRDT